MIARVAPAGVPLIAGIVLAALGVEEVLAHVGDGKALGWLAAAALHAGLVLYLLGHVAFKRRLHGAISRPRLVTAAALGAATPLSASIAPLPALALVVVIVGVLAAFETARYGHVRRSLRQTHV